MDFKLITLGTSAAGPVPGRWPSGQYLKTAKFGFLLDCGEGIQIALQAQGIGWSAVDVLLISHLHGDHIYGLPGLLTSWGLNQRTAPLTIISPPGLEAYINAVLKASYSGLPFSINYIVADTQSCPEIVFEDKQLTVTTLPLVHRIPTVGYLIKEKERTRTMSGAAIQAHDIPYTAIPAIKAGGDFQTTAGAVIPNAALTLDPPASRSFAYCSDTAPNPDLISLITGVDILFHEATFLHELKEQAAASGHSTSRQAAEMALAAKAGQLILGHFSPRYGDLRPILEEAKQVFPASELAKEGKVFEVAYGGRNST